MLYDIEELLKGLKITEEEKKKIIREIKEEFPNDEMLYELHLFRMVQFLKKIKIDKDNISKKF